MQENNTGKIVGVNGALINVAFDTQVTQNEVAYVLVGEQRLKCEVIRVRGDRADLQIFEDAKGLRIGDAVEFTGELLSVELGPGLLTMVYDGLQNPLDELAEAAGFFLKRGLYLSPLDREKKWAYTPTVKEGDAVVAGDTLGTTPEGIYTHQVMLPFSWAGKWTVKSVVEAGDHTVDTVVATLANERGEERSATMVQTWPVKRPISCYKEKLLPRETLVTQTRIIDSFFPVAKGGTFCTPGPFGAGKTVLQHALAQYSQTDIVIVAACGERAGEVVEILREFPHVPDPKTGKTLIERTIIICNTSSMPVAAREASVYTAITLAEYYRQMGLDCLLLADSTSRWAQALREMSGRLEEIPGEEAFPAYLESLVASFYERSGLVRLNSGETGSVTIGGAVSPAGGNFEEPVTQATLKVVGAFLGLSRERANARRFPSIHPLDSWSKYNSIVDADKLEAARDTLSRGMDIHQMMMVVGEEGTSIEDYATYLKGEFLDAVYLQQNTFDKVDGATSAERQREVFEVISEVIEASFEFKDKAAARQYFNELRQLAVDWNYAAPDSPEFEKQKTAIAEKLTEEAVHA